MNYFFKTLLISTTAIVSSCSASNEETLISLTEMPERAIAFVNEYFKNQKINKIEKDVNDINDYYSIDFANGESADFTKDGAWTSVEAPDGKPLSNTAFIPESIRSYTSQHYQSNPINGISKTNNGFEVDLVGSPKEDIELLFDLSGAFLQVKK